VGGPHSVSTANYKWLFGKKFRNLRFDAFCSIIAREDAEKAAKLADKAQKAANAVANFQPKTEIQRIMYTHLTAE
jgi:hypothetical protein